MGIRVGAVLWIVTVQAVIVDAIWSETVCKPFEGGYACSPLPGMFTLSQIVFGLLVIAGAWLTSAWWPRTLVARAGLTSLGVSGLGAVVAVNVDPSWHDLTTHGTFASQNVGLLLLGIALWRRWRAEAVFTLIGALVGTVLLIQGQYLELGSGGVASGAFSVWLVGAGSFLLTRGRPQVKRPHLTLVTTTGGTSSLRRSTWRPSN